MVKTIERVYNPKNIEEVIAQDPKQYSFGQVAREITDLNNAGVWFEIGIEDSEERKLFTATIEGRLNTLYAEFDRREEENKKIAAMILEYFRERRGL